MQGRARLPERGAEEEGEEIAAGVPAHARLIEALRRPACYPHPVGEVVLVETHISWVLLAGEFAYKLKKPVDFGFLDFSTLELRKACCDEEVRVNRRTAPSIYLDVVAIGGTPDRPKVGGDRGEPIEWAVRMRRFRRDDEFDALARRGDLDRAHVESLAEVVARFHETAAVATPAGPWGGPAAVLAPCVANFEQLASLAIGKDRQDRLARLREWTLREHARLAPLIGQRLADGRVRECHGDLHMANIVLIDGEPVLFDAIEFNPALRWIDVIAEIAFVVMDLEHRDRHALAQRFLDAYLAHSGDYQGLALLRFHLVYRAIVRTKVAALRATQASGGVASPGSDETREIDDHLSLAERFARRLEARMLLTHGVSGSGKSHVAGMLLETGQWIRLRSDVERKRIAGIAPLGHSGSQPDEGVYTSDATERVYARLAMLARTVIEAGYPVIVDATFLRAAQRRRFAELARRMNVGWAILATRARPRTLRERVARRAESGRDPSEATIDVLERQLRSAEPIGGDERTRTVEVDTGTSIDTDALDATIRAATS